MENEEVKISVIVPIYNVERYLDAALKSVLKQKVNFELILINDGSTDSSLEIIKKYDTKYNNIIVINQENKGQSSARNAGIREAKGKYVYFFDSDDILEQNALATLYNIMEKHKLDLLMFSGTSFNDTDNEMELDFNYKKTHVYSRIESGKEIIIQLINNDDYTPSPCLYMVERNLIMKNKLAFYEGIIHEDILFTYEILETSKRVKVIKDELFHRRIRNDSTITKQNYFEKFTGLYAILKVLLEKKMLYIENDKKFYDASLEIISGVYGNTVRNYIYMTKLEKRKVKDVLKKVREIGQNEKDLKRLDYKIFCLSPRMYEIIRKFFDKNKSYFTNKKIRRT